ncbi:2-keto-4-pentenoate hydratase/2-oxohepta-3-ene-1,7-dioic acid hydratase (catechol pathway) [Natronorubrum sediminis]|uniref:2-keto-4-pentenoate hydratase/2-oxohepta-3-ene-1,7-dioic acid hydratase (Catechol pathway) n=1 Tax=Natronorubrum sediminis TaxID=640943 RepID=A0A1H6FTT7_9EURY|nr:fumarylacetoacetate hydrolase family protein [Natronorubrum sediminis]SEH13578.1 2-keto-4-pentenoate hydratase/2-oxohepta-3-ene-1,7-dioic acid hydratase (catechol pathway) [Natronorubrum sediminis]
MRIGRFTTAETDQCWYGVSISDQEIVNVPEACTAAGIDLSETESKAPVDDAWQRNVERALEHVRGTNTAVYSTAEVERLAPIADPEKIVCVGLNYRDHAEEGDNPIPDEPVLFSKFPTTISGPGDTISWDPDLTEKVDYEAELVVVIGTEARRVDEDEAFEHVAGYLVGNDVSARDLQHGDGQWVRGKSLDGFAPIGPDLVTADEVSDPHNLEIWAEVNGERLQESTTDNLIFGIDELVSFCSQAFTLNPGDLVFTGTPPGVGVYRDPPVLLEDGDEVTIGIDELGELTNTCAFE